MKQWRCTTTIKLKTLTRSDSMKNAGMDEDGHDQNMLHDAFIDCEFHTTSTR